MSESEIIIPVSSINRKNSLSVEKSTTVSNKSTRQVEVTLSKFLKILSSNDLNVVSQKYSDSKIHISADLLLDLASMEEEPIESPQNMSYLVVGLMGALFLSFLILLIYLV